MVRGLAIGGQILGVLGSLASVGTLLFWISAFMNGIGGSYGGLLQSFTARCSRAL